LIDSVTQQAGRPGGILDEGVRVRDTAAGRLPAIDSTVQPPGRPEGGALTRALPAPTAASAELVDVLIGLLEYRDPYFRGSSSFVRLLAVGIGRELSLDEEWLRWLAMAALLRDLGRIAMKGELISPFSPVPEDHERARIEQHVATGLDLLSGVALPDPVRLAIRHHHESWNGTGYPDRLAGDRIPLLARILRVADAMAATLSPRPYRPPKRAPDALREIRDGAGALYDPTIVDALVTLLRNLDPAEIGFSLRGHLLLVHADPARATSLAVHLGSAGFLVDVAVDLASARERLARLPFLGALIAAREAGSDRSTDDPVEFVTELRAHPSFQAIPVIGLDVPSPATRLELIRGGFDSCFSTEADPHEIVATMHASLRRTAVIRRYLSPDGADELGEMMELAGESVSVREDRGAPEATRALYALHGSLREFPLIWLLQAMQYDRRTAIVHLSHDEAEALLALEDGELSHASVGELHGDEAISQLLGWSDGAFRVQHGARTMHRTVHTPLIHLILDHARLQDEADPIFGAVIAS
jgi:DNA-binding response OmpR family regulator